jgi:hypothetical protein
VLYGIITIGPAGSPGFTEKGSGKVLSGWPAGRNFARGVGLKLAINEWLKIKSL